MTLVSLPITSMRRKMQQRGPFSSGMKPSGRIPILYSPSGVPTAGRTSFSPMKSLPPRTLPVNIFMGGVPRNFATNIFTGWS